MKVSKWGNSLAMSRKPARRQLIERLRAYQGRLPDDFKFNREEVNARWPASRDQRKLWKEQNRGAIEAYNALVATHGSLGDDLGTF